MLVLVVVVVLNHKIVVVAVAGIAYSSSTKVNGMGTMSKYDIFFRKSCI